MPDTPSFRAKISKVAEIDKPWSILLVDIEPFASFTIEFFGNAGGISRYYPRGRNEMTVRFLHKQAGDAHVAIVARNERCLGVLGCIGDFRIVPASVQGYSATPYRDPDDDEWRRKMEEIERRFAWKDQMSDHDRSREYEELARHTILPATGKPPVSTPWHPDAAAQPAVASPAMSFAPDPTGASFFASTSRFSARPY